ncbi:Uncharacterised protein [Shigella sonnei]|nr:Uncharacterised protein [Shigella sonnei]
MKIRHEHIESVLLPWQPKKGRRGSLTQLLKNICGRGAANCLWYQARTGTISRISITVG